MKSFYRCRQQVLVFNTSTVKYNEIYNIFADVKKLLFNINIQRNSFLGNQV